MRTFYTFDCNDWFKNKQITQTSPMRISLRLLTVSKVKCSAGVAGNFLYAHNEGSFLRHEVCIGETTDNDRERETQRKRLKLCVQTKSLPLNLTVK